MHVEYSQEMMAPLYAFNCPENVMLIFTLLTLYAGLYSGRGVGLLHIGIYGDSGEGWGQLLADGGQPAIRKI